MKTCIFRKNTSGTTDTILRPYATWRGDDLSVSRVCRYPVSDAVYSTPFIFIPHLIGGAFLHFHPPATYTLKPDDSGKSLLERLHIPETPPPLQVIRRVPAHFPLL